MNPQDEIEEDSFTADSVNGFVVEYEKTHDEFLVPPTPFLSYWKNGGRDEQQ